MSSVTTNIHFDFDLCKITMKAKSFGDFSTLGLVIEGTPGDSSTTIYFLPAQTFERLTRAVSAFNAAMIEPLEAVS